MDRRTTPCGAVRSGRRAPVRCSRLRHLLRLGGVVGAWSRRGPAAATLWPVTPPWEHLLGVVNPFRLFSAATACSAHPLAPARVPRRGVPPCAARCSQAAENKRRGEGRVVRRAHAGSRCRTDGRGPLSGASLGAADGHGPLWPWMDCRRRGSAAGDQQS